MLHLCPAPLLALSIEIAIHRLPASKGFGQHAPMPRKSKKGYDATKKTKGRKRHRFGLTMGLLGGCDVCLAGRLPSPEGLKVVLRRYFVTGLKRLRKVWVDGDYRGERM